MKFQIQNALCEDPLKPGVGKAYPVLGEKWGAVSSEETAPWHEHAVIEINSIEQLLELAKDLGRRLIVGTCEEPGSPHLTIYDDYIE